MFDWDDLKPLLALSRHGSLLAAARALGANQTTLQRRITALERRLGRPLVIRDPAGYRLTSLGQDAAAAAARMEREAEAFALVARRAAKSREILRLTCPEPVAPRLRPLVAAFEVEHPDIEVRFVTSDRYLDLSKGEADIAFRSGDTDADLVGRKVADSIWSVYASRDYVARHGAPVHEGELGDHALLSLDAAMNKHRLVSWLTTVAPDAIIAGRSSSILGLIAVAKSGLGIAALPANLADSEEDLVRAFGPVPALQRTWRLLTRPDLREKPAIAAFFAFAATQRSALKDILM